MAEERITLVVDAGANTGQWARELRDAGYTGRIASFEPGSAAYEALARAANGDAAWSAFRAALGRAEGNATLHVTANSVSSSLYPIARRQVEVDPRTAAVGTETVDVLRLDATDLVEPHDRLLLKADVEGFEVDVLEGARGVLERVRLLELELSAVPLRDGQPLLGEVTYWCEREGFFLTGIEVSYRDHATGDLLAVNGFFRRS
jgi:FkbM family methyltransferase